MATPKRKALRSYRLQTLREELPAQFAPGRSPDEVFEAAYSRYQETGSPADRDALIAAILPSITAMAIRRKMRGVVNSETDDLISDGCLAVMNVIHRHGDRPLERFRRILFGAIKLQIRQSICDRMWAGGKRSGTRDNHTMLQIRSIFLKQHGRMPTGVELRAALDTMIDNGQIEKEFTRKTMTPASVVDEDAIDLLAQLGTDSRPGPIYEVMGRETMKIALRGLKGDDRKIFKLAIEGVNVNEIAKRVGISRASAHDRINGLLWSARLREELAAHLGCEPAQAVQRNALGKLVSMKNVPPARLVA